MNPGGDAAEQVVRISLEGMEYAVKISGSGAKQLALMLYAAAKQEQKTKGRARLSSLLRSGKELKIYTITQKDLPKFSQEAKRYGVLYCVLKDRANTDPDAQIDIIARADDASKISRIHERFELSGIAREGVSIDVDKELEKYFPSNPSMAKTDRDPPSEPGSAQANLSSGPTGSRSSVREKLNAYKADIEKTKEAGAREKVKEGVSKIMGAAKDAAKSVPMPKAPGKER